MARLASRVNRSTEDAQVEVILDQLGSHSSTREGRAAATIDALGPGTFPYLLKALRTHQNAFARAVAAQCLLRFGGRARAALLRALRDPAMPVRLTGLLVLDQLWGAKVERSILRLLRDPRPGIRHNATRVLARHHAVTAVPQLTRLLNDPVWHVRQQAARALGILGAERAVPALWQAASDPRQAVRNAARDALRRLEAV